MDLLQITEILHCSVSIGKKTICCLEVAVSLHQVIEFRNVQFLGVYEEFDVVFFPPCNFPKIS